MIEAWRTRTLADGTKLDFGHTEKEQGFVVRDDGLFSAAFNRSGLPGPEYARLAIAPDRPAYAIGERGAFAIKHDNGRLEVRQLAGKPLTPAEPGEVGRAVARWNGNNGGSGERCTFVPH